MSNGIQNVRRWAYSYVEARGGMPSREDMDAMAATNGVADIVVFAMVQSAISEMEDREHGFLSPDDMDGIEVAI